MYIQHTLDNYLYRANLPVLQFLSLTQKNRWNNAERGVKAYSLTLVYLIKIILQSIFCATFSIQIQNVTRVSFFNISIFITIMSTNNTSSAIFTNIITVSCWSRYGLISNTIYKHLLSLEHLPTNVTWGQGRQQKTLSASTSY